MDQSCTFLAHIIDRIILKNSFWEFADVSTLSQKVWKTFFCKNVSINDMQLWSEFHVYTMNQTSYSSFADVSIFWFLPNFFRVKLPHSHSSDLHSISAKVCVGSFCNLETKLFDKPYLGRLSKFTRDIGKSHRFFPPVQICKFWLFFPPERIRIIIDTGV